MTKTSRKATRKAIATMMSESDAIIATMEAAGEIAAITPDTDSAIVAVTLVTPEEAANDLGVTLDSPATLPLKGEDTPADAIPSETQSNGTRKGRTTRRHETPFAILCEGGYSLKMGKHWGHATITTTPGNPFGYDAAKVSHLSKGYTDLTAAANRKVSYMIKTIRADEYAANLLTYLPLGLHPDDAAAIYTRHNLDVTSIFGSDWQDLVTVKR